MTNPCAPSACGSCPLSGMCGAGDDLPPAVFEEAPDVDPDEPKPDGAACCGGQCVS
ncbi:hypothetical protein GCM10023317_04820 [Actinopolymorpha pittospori]|uniref:Uncharacterized protein n=1 Tax=Actinopolymorpha pittospori TaxID=648752 RepID=A0A927RK09_9ACTN|nr:hypothetical protein [Actinopolymorpha pittospori]